MSQSLNGPDCAGGLDPIMERSTMALVSGDECQLRGGVRDLTAALAATDDDPRRNAMLGLQLALVHDRLFMVTGDREELENAVLSGMAAAAAVPAADDPDRGDVLTTVAQLLIEAFDHLGGVSLLDEAVRLARTALGEDPDSERTLMLALRCRFEAAGCPADLSEAEQCAQAIVEAGSATGEDYGEYAHILRLRYDRSGAPDEAARAVAAARAAVARTPADSDSYRQHTALLAGTLLDAYQGGDRATLGDAVEAARRAVVDDNGADPPDAAVYQTAAMVVNAWAEDRLDLDAAREAEGYARAALVVAQDDAEQTFANDALSTTLHTAFALTADLGLLDAAITAARAAAQSEAADTPDEAGYHGNLAVALVERYSARSTVEDLHEAIRHSRQAADMLDRPHPDRGRYLNNLAVALRLRYDAIGTFADLIAAIDAAREALTITNTSTHPYRLSTLGSLLISRFHHSGELEYLDENIRLNWEAITHLPDGSPDTAGLLCNLSTALRERYQHLGTERDLADAVETGRLAMQAPTRPVDVTDVADAYALALHAMSTAHADPAQLDEAIAQSLRAVTLTDRDHPGLPGRIGNLVSMLTEASTDHAETLATAVDWIDSLLGNLPAGHSERAGLYTNLALARHHHNPADPAAVLAADQALAELGPEHPDRAQCLINLAFVLLDHNDQPDRRTRHRATEALRQAALHPTAPPVVRWRAAQAWSRHAGQDGDTAAAADGAALAVELLPSISPRRLARSDAQRWLAQAAGTAAAAAALAFSAGRDERALGLLEQGRGVLLHRSLRLRGDHARLHAVQPGLSMEFDRLRDALDSQETTPSPVGEHLITRAGAERAVAVRHRERLGVASSEFAAIIDRIRAAGFPEFLQAPTARSLAAGLGDRTAVIINISEYRCDALIVQADRYQVLPLPEVREADVDEHALRFHQALNVSGDQSCSTNDRRRAETDLTEILDWLWRRVAQPIMAELPQPGADRGPERVWWVPTGTLTFLPLHAAGLSDGTDSVLDRVISSYTPTLEALHHAVTRSIAETATRPVVIVSSAVDDDTDPLPATVKEALEVARTLGADIIDAAKCSREEILEVLASTSQLHIAMHARADADNPSHSGLLLPSGTLTVAELAAHRNNKAVFAYLSACESTLTTAALADEAIHLTNAFQLLGCRAVVGTGWAVSDAVAARAARSFYQRLTHTPGDTIAAVHHTQRVLRQRYSGRPSAWAAFHHVGA